MEVKLRSKLFHSHFHAGTFLANLLHIKLPPCVGQKHRAHWCKAIQAMFQGPEPATYFQIRERLRSTEGRGVKHLNSPQIFKALIQFLTTVATTQVQGECLLA